MTNEEMLALVEQGEIDATRALDELKALWAREDEQTAANRAAVMEAHANGDRDRDAARVKYGGVSKFELKSKSKRASDLPVTEIAALKDKP